MTTATKLLALVALPGCALTTIGGTFTATRPYTKTPHAYADVTLFFVGDDSPTCGPTRVGMITYSGNKTGTPWGRRTQVTDAEALEGMRGYVASLGLDGALDVRCGGGGACDGIAFVCPREVP